MVILGRCLGAKAQVQGGAISGFDIWPRGLPALPHFGSQARRVCVELHTLSEAKRGAFAKNFRIALMSEMKWDDKFDDAEQSY